MDECTEAEKIRGQGHGGGLWYTVDRKTKDNKNPSHPLNTLIVFGICSLFHLHFHQPAVNPSTSRLARRKPPQEADYFPIPFELQ